MPFSVWKIWEGLLDNLTLEEATELAESVRKRELSVRKADVKAALQAEAEVDGQKVRQEVPGARFSDVHYSLVVK
jgi:hypothetical protein